MRAVFPPNLQPRNAGLLGRGLLAIGVVLTLVLAGAVALPSHPAHAQGKSRQKKSGKAEEAPRRVVLVFPPDVANAETSDDGFNPEQLTDIVVDVIQSRLKSVGGYRTVYYSRGLPTIRRAVIEGTLTTAEADRPFSPDEKVRKLAQLAGHDLVLVSSIDDYQYDPEKNQVTLVMSARLIDFAPEKKAIRAVGESITGPEAPKGKKQLEVALEAARALTEKMINELLRPAKPASEQKPQEPSEQKP
ncbi:MAG: hypothetical protein RMJ43_13610 [Chloroherpetonaceae bacterium]|nr:hypothetical protein [Chthonomonadaceae bacterium]MDW8208866.1 hypothetical protein [Chloroherpetonaceae bacterium]